MYPIAKRNEKILQFFVVIRLNSQYVHPCITEGGTTTYRISQADIVHSFIFSHNRVRHQPFASSFVPFNDMPVNNDIIRTISPMVIMPANKPHTLRAIEKFKMMLIMIMS